MPPVDGAADEAAMPLSTGVPDPLEAFAAQLDLAMRAGNVGFFEAAQAWHALAKIQVELIETAGRAFGGLLLDWHGRFLRR